MITYTTTETLLEFGISGVLKTYTTDTRPRTFLSIVWANGEVNGEEVEISFDGAQKLIQLLETVKDDGFIRCAECNSEIEEATPFTRLCVGCEGKA